MHSHTYRVPEIFKDKKVVLLGGSYSGVEIALEVSTVAAQTYLSHNNPKKYVNSKVYHSNNNNNNNFFFRLHNYYFCMKHYTYFKMVQYLKLKYYYE